MDKKIVTQIVMKLQLRTLIKNLRKTPLKNTLERKFT
jgi:hypothetical protein